MLCYAYWSTNVVHALLATLLMLRSPSSAAAAAASYFNSQNTADYSRLGPCNVEDQPLETLLLPEASGCGSYCRLSPRLHLPMSPNSSTTASNPSSSTAQASSTRCSAAFLPTVVFFSGFQLRSAYYTPYARWLASWGYVCVQYDLALFHIVPDEVELGYLPYLLDYLQHQPSIKGRLNLNRIGAAGHSRGGKLAALHLADDARVVAAFLVDPVDSGGNKSSSAARGSLKAVSATGRSAVQALAGKHKQAAIAGEAELRPHTTLLTVHNRATVYSRDCALMFTCFCRKDDPFVDSTASSAHQDRPVHSRGVGPKELCVTVRAGRCCAHPPPSATAVELSFSCLDHCCLL
eukprot:GHRQ01024706.1.p1 GENE.GHRQ01024706.1~~GHRQ01024706.1.p1  ORF type:complete len:349 (+),score=82.36 GHRQ01024706.1:130-1176(+)